MTEQVMMALRTKIVASGVSNVVIGDLPTLETDVVAINPTEGSGNAYYFGKDKLDMPLVHCVVRNKDYKKGQDIYNVIAKNLDQYADRTSGILSCFLAGTPGYLGKDTIGFHEWSMIFRLTLNID